MIESFKKNRNTLLFVLISIFIGFTFGIVCYHARGLIFPGPGDFNMALDFAKAILTGEDPYNFTPTIHRIGVPFPVGFFGLPFVMIPGRLAAAIFFGISSFLLALGILLKGKKWQLLMFTTFPFFYALLFAQWSPIITATWFIPFLAPLFLLIKPNIALPIAINRITVPGIILASIVLLISLFIYPSWPIRWLQMVGEYQYIIPIFTLPFGPIMLLSLIFWYDPRARLLLGMSVVPIRAAYDLLPLWLAPTSRRHMLLLVIFSLFIPVINISSAVEIRPKWVIPVLYIPTLFFIIQSNWSSVRTFREIFFLERIIGKA